MKIFRIILTAAFVFGLAASAMGFEGNGSDMPRGIHGYGAGDGTGPIHDVLSGEQPVPITGTVKNVGPFFEGLEIDTGSDETITVYGIGPLFYWDSIGIARPVVGDVITVNGVDVAFSDGSTRTVAISITIGTDTIPLRDEKTGLPLWGRNQENGNGRMKHDHRKGFRNQTCPAAEADSEESL
ncbi:hypothetical protein [Desulfococcus sp.]|uniref:hypothetical protein n=1 Tax=Desulfococcus sp. TaxID=2025834 RepID=UPI003593111D